MADTTNLDPQARAFLDRLLAAGRPGLETLSPTDARAANAMLTRFCAGPPIEIGSVVEHAIPGPRGPIGSRIYTPASFAGSEEDAPVLVYYHGGGFVIGDLDMVDATCRMLANLTPCIVVSVDYRLAPENPYPAPREDAFAAFVWASSEAASFGGDPRRVAVGGDSAGATLAAVVAQIARDTGVRPPCFQLLVYPAPDRVDRPSMVEFGDGFLLTRSAMAWFSRSHHPGPHVRDPYLTPADASDLSNLAPALVITAGFDPLRDGGEAYAERLAGAGVPVELVRYDGMIHGFFAFPSVFDVAREAIAHAASSLGRAFERNVARAQGGSRLAE
jgi:acetyl esterase